jgi:hypothetical protein
MDSRRIHPNRGRIASWECRTDRRERNGGRADAGRQRARDTRIGSRAHPPARKTKRPPVGGGLQGANRGARVSAARGRANRRERGVGKDNLGHEACGVGGGREPLARRTWGTLNHRWNRVNFVLPISTDSRGSHSGTMNRRERRERSAPSRRASYSSSFPSFSSVQGLEFEFGKRDLSTTSFPVQGIHRGRCRTARRGYSTGRWCANQASMRSRISGRYSCPVLVHTTLRKFSGLPYSR